MQTATQRRLSCCHGLYSVPTRRPLRLRLDLRESLSATELHRCGRKGQSCQAMAYGTQQPMQQPREQLSLAVRPQPALVLAESQLTGKQVVTRLSGRILGVVDGLVTDPETCKVVAISLNKSNNALPGEEPQQISLMSLTQISDVLLVHDERAILREQLTLGMPYIQLIGKAVKTADNKLVGKVRDFDFCPDDGRITRMVIDALGIPAVPRRLLASQGIQMQLVQRATWSSITLYPGAEANIEKLTTGIFDSAINLLKNSVPFMSLITAGDREAVDADATYTNWWLDNAEDYERFYGKRMPRPSDAAIAAAQAARQQGWPQTPRAPQALPSPSQTTYASQLQPQVPAATQQLQAEPASWLQADALRQPQQAQQQYSNWQQASAPQQAQRGERAQQQYSGQQDQWQPSYANGSQQPSSFQQDSLGWQDSQPGTKAFQQPDALQFSSQQDTQSQAAGAPQQSRAQQQQAGPSQQQPQQQQQSFESQNYNQSYNQRMSRQSDQRYDQGFDQGYDQRQQATLQQPSSYAGSARKVEQQRRSSARQTAGVEEPRFDPRRRRASQGQSTMPGQNVQQRQAPPPPDPQTGADDVARRTQSQPYPNSPPVPQQLPRQADGAAGPSSVGAFQYATDPVAVDQGYSAWLDQQRQNRGQLSEPSQALKTSQAASRPQQYNGWAKQESAAVVATVAVSPDGSIDVA